MRVPRFILVLVVVGATGIMWWRLSRQIKRADEVVPEVVARPIPQVPGADYITSDACLDCHPDQHASWHRTYHRTMTQVLTPETMLAPLDGEVSLTTRGRTSRLWRKGHAYWIDMVDPDWDMQQYRETGLSFADGPRASRQIVMATGSHHIQTYWVNGRRGNQLHQVPWAYHLAAERWIPLPDIFILPPDAPANLMTTWNEVCIQCHAVRGQPGYDAGRDEFDSKFTELGIACEACHGPGEPHQERMHKLARDGVTDFADLELNIVNPSTLPHEASAHVCGQCHSDFMIVGDEFWRTGHPYRPGDDLLATRAFPEIGPGMAAYWDDGTARVGGREFTAMEQSACYQRGEMSCLSCHSMHQAPPNDQLTAGMETDHACLQCHTEYADRIEEHSHHPAESSGSRCYNCHMPYIPRSP